MKLPNHIYLDTDYVTQAYETKTGRRVPVRITKTLDVAAGLSGVVVNAGASMKEQKEYPISVNAMYSEIAEVFAAIPSIDLEHTKAEDIPELFWVEGLFGMSQSSRYQGAERLSTTPCFQYVPRKNYNGYHLTLVANDTYFASGYDQLMRHGDMFSLAFAIRARLLLRLLSTETGQGIAAPLIIIKTSNYA